MTYFAITAQYPVFTELDGTPLENGYIYIGAENENPITNPITVYWDDALEYPAAQPIRTLAGAPNRNGSPGNLFSETRFSIIVRDKNQNQVYYSPNGVKAFTDDTYKFYRNYIINGKFDIKQINTLDREVDRWQENYSGVSLVTNRLAFSTSDRDRPKENSKYYIELSPSNIGTLDSDYSRFVTVVEDVTELAGKNVTLSFYAKSEGVYRFAISMTQKMPDGSASPDVVGIGKRIFTAGTTFERYMINVDMPSINDTDINYASGSNQVGDELTSGTLINIWIDAGSDFDEETGGLGHVSETGAQIYFTDFRLNEGPIIIDDNDLTFAETFEKCQRYYERSFSKYDLTTANSAAGHLTYIAPLASATIPGFQFKKEKRTETPDVHVYSYNSHTIDTVYYDGVGDIAVSSYDDVTSSGIGTITLASPTVDGGIYKFHYVVDDEFIL